MKPSFTWDILQIEPTTEEPVIKRAYFALLKIYTPEAYPAEFQKLREAYEAALQSCRDPQRSERAQAGTLETEQIQPQASTNVEAAEPEADSLAFQLFSRLTPLIEAGDLERLDQLLTETLRQSQWWAGPATLDELNLRLIDYFENCQTALPDLLVCLYHHLEWQTRLSSLQGRYPGEKLANFQTRLALALSQARQARLEAILQEFIEALARYPFEYALKELKRDLAAYQREAPDVESQMEAFLFKWLGQSPLKGYDYLGFCHEMLSRIQLKPEHTLFLEKAEYDHVLIRMEKEQQGVELKTELQPHKSRKPDDGPSDYEGVGRAVAFLFVAALKVAFIIFLVAPKSPSIGAAETETAPVKRPRLADAVLKGRSDLIGPLVQAGANPDEMLPYSHVRVIQYATRQGDIDVVRKLLEQGAQVDALDESKQRTALIEAVNRGNQELTELLIAHNADPTLQPADGISALELAVKQNQPTMVKLLLSTKQYDWHSPEHQKALERAKEMGVEELLQALQAPVGY